MGKGFESMVEPNTNSHPRTPRPDFDSLDAALSAYLDAAPGPGGDDERAEVLRRRPELAQKLGALIEVADALRLPDLDGPSYLEVVDGDDEISPLTAGMLFGKYRIEAPIGTGGMGRVYRAVQLTTERVVALKIARLAAHSERIRREPIAQASSNH